MNVSRRQFLSSAAALSIAPFAKVRASEPIARTGRPYFKLSLAAYSFNRFLPKNWPKPSKSDPTMTIEDFVDFCAEMDLDGTELTSYYFPAEITPAYLASLKERTFRLGLDISGTAIGNDFCLADGPDRDFQFGMTRQWIDYAATLGAPVIRIFAGDTPKGDTESAALERCVAGIETSLEYAAEKGVALAIENHGGITSTAEQLLRIVKAVKPSPWFGVNFDSGNFHSSDPYAEMELMAPYALNAQIKISITAEGRKKEEADLGRVVSILRGVGYRGYLVLEYEEEEDPRVAIPRHLKVLKGLVGRG
jgi:sugar phosphate isomerase/epimerase